MSRDVVLELVDAAFPTGGTDGPNAWTDERIRVRTRFAEQAGRILSDYEAVARAAERELASHRCEELDDRDDGQEECVFTLELRAALARLREGEAAHV